MNIEQASVENIWNQCIKKL